MAGVQDHVRTIGNEAVAFATRAATLTRGIEHQFGQEPQPNIEMRRSRGMRPGVVARPNDRVISIPRNGKIPVEVDLMDKSHGLLLAAIGSSVVSATPMGATDARTHTITPTTTGPVRSMTIHDEVPQTDGSVSVIDYLGCMAETLVLSVQPKSFWKLHVDFDYDSDNLAASSVTPAYPSTPRVFLDTDTTTTLDSVVRDPLGITLTLPTGIKTDLDRASATGRRKPITTNEIVGTGEIGIDYLSTALWAKWKAGTSMPLSIVIANPNANAIESTFTYSLTITIPAVRLTGAPPDRAEGDITAQKLPFEIVYDGSNAPYTLVYQTTDTAP